MSAIDTGGKVLYLSEVAPERGGLFADAPEVLTCAHAADLLGVSVRTVQREINAGRLESFHVGARVRIQRRALVEYVERQARA